MSFESPHLARTPSLPLRNMCLIRDFNDALFIPYIFCECEVCRKSAIICYFVAQSDSWYMVGIFSIAQQWLTPKALFLSTAQTALDIYAFHFYASRGLQTLLTLLFAEDSFTNLTLVLLYPLAYIYPLSSTCTQLSWYTIGLISFCLYAHFRSQWNLHCSIVVAADVIDKARSLQSLVLSLSFLNALSQILLTLAKIQCATFVHEFLDGLLLKDAYHNSLQW